MQFRILIALLLCLMLGTGCSAPLAFPLEETAQPAETPLVQAPQAQAPTPSPELFASSASYGFPYAAIDGDTVYWCTSHGVLAMNAKGGARLFSDKKGTRPLVMGGYLYMVIEETDVTDEVAWPVPVDAVTASNIVRIPLSGGEAETIYTAPYINSLFAGDGRLYFSTTQGEALQDAGGLFSIDAKGEDERLLAEDCTMVYALQDGYVYYIGIVEEAPAFFRVDIAGGVAEQLLAGPGLPVTPLVYRGDVYYVNMDFTAEDGASNLAVMRLRDGKSEAHGITAQELLGIWNDTLYYAAPAKSDSAPLSLCLLDLSTLQAETLQKDVAQFAAVSGEYVLYSNSTSIASATELNLKQLPSGAPITLKIEDVVKSIG